MNAASVSSLKNHFILTKNNNIYLLNENGTNIRFLNKPGSDTEKKTASYGTSHVMVEEDG